MNKYLKVKIPWFLAHTRLFLAPLSIAMVLFNFTGLLLALILAIALLTDIFDGVLARKWNTSSDSLRLYDSNVDTVFAIAFFASICLAYKNYLSPYIGWFLIIIVIEVIRYIFELLKFKKGASYHSYLAKTFGLSLFITAMFFLCFGATKPFFYISICIGFIASIEGFLMSIILPKWHCDIKHLGIAFSLCKK